LSNPALAAIRMIPYHCEKFSNIGQALCPDCGTDQFFSLVEETFTVSTTYHLVCNQCGHKARISRKTALQYMPHQSLLESHPLVIGWTVFFLLLAATVIIALVKG